MAASSFQVFTQTLTPFLSQPTSNPFWILLAPFQNTVEDVPGGPVAKTLLPMQQAWVQPLIKELDPTAASKTWHCQIHIICMIEILSLLKPWSRHHHRLSPQHCSKSPCLYPCLQNVLSTTASMILLDHIFP